MDEWIKVEDKMPKDCGCYWVLVSIVEKNGFRWIPRIAEYIEKRHEWHIVDDETTRLYDNYEARQWLKVTHWMPLPPLPEMKEG